MSTVIKIPAKCEVQAGIQFFAKNYSAAAIQREICAVYILKVMSKNGQVTISDRTKNRIILL